MTQSTYTESDVKSVYHQFTTLLILLAIVFYHYLLLLPCLPIDTSVPPKHINRTTAKQLYTSLWYWTRRHCLIQYCSESKHSFPPILSLSLINTIDMFWILPFTIPLHKDPTVTNVSGCGACQYCNSRNQL